jgi:hypothetical protein
VGGIVGAWNVREKQDMFEGVFDEHSDLQTCSLYHPMGNANNNNKK